MRKSLLGSQILSLIVFSTALASTDVDIQGVWKNTQKEISITVKVTNSGIRVRRIDQTTWYAYEEYREGQYRDREGNNYYIVDENTLEWEDNKGERRLRFSRSMTEEALDAALPVSPDEGYQAGAPHSGNTYIKRNHYVNGNQISAHSLEGRWQNPSTGQMIVVRGKTNMIKVKARRSSWVSFSRVDQNTFVDGIGNRYDLRKGLLEYTSHSGDFFMRFSRAR
jgi:hypothetical protein